MSHPDPLYDSDNSHEDDIMDNEEIFEMDGVECGREDGFDDENSGEVDWNYNDDMDGDHDSAMSSCGWGTDEDYGYYGEDDGDIYDYHEDFHSDDGYGVYDDGE